MECVPVFFFLEEESLLGTSCSARDIDESVQLHAPHINQADISVTRANDEWIGDYIESRHLCQLELTRIVNLLLMNDLYWHPVLDNQEVYMIQSDNNLSTFIFQQSVSSLVTEKYRVLSHIQIENLCLSLHQIIFLTSKKV